MDVRRRHEVRLSSLPKGIFLSLPKGRLVTRFEMLTQPGSLEIPAC